MSEEKTSKLLRWIRRVLNFALTTFDKDFPEVKPDKD